MDRTRKVTFLGLAAAAALVLAFVEHLIPQLMPAVKMGLPNIVIIFVLYRLGPASAAAVSAVRVVLANLLFGSVMGFWYSAAGAVLSLLVMWLLMKTRVFSPVGVSVCGGVAHNAAQTAVAVAVTGVASVGYYMIILCISGVAAGVLVGLAGGYVIMRAGAYGEVKRREKRKG